MEEDSRPHEDSIAQFRSKLVVYKFNSPSPRYRRSANLEPSSSQSSQASTESDVLPVFHKSTPASTTEPDTDDELPVATTNPRKRARRSAEPLPGASGRKAKKPKRGYAPPETYKHLHMLPDYLEQYLDIMFCGINPGCTSAEIGHHYAHATNHFWETLHLSGLTDRLVSAEEDYMLPDLFNYGLTNLVDRPSAEQSELSQDEMRGAVPDLMSKILKYRPRVVCFLARSIWDLFSREVFRLAQALLPPPVPEPPKTPRRSKRPRNSKETPRLVASRFFSTPNPGSPEPTSAPSTPKTETKRGKRVQMPKYTFDWGLQPFKVVHRQLYDTPPLVRETLFFVVPSPSARVVRYQWWDKVEKFKELKSCLDQVKAAKINTTDMHVVPSAQIASRSIYFIVPKDA